MLRGWIQRPAAALIIEPRYTEDFIAVSALRESRLRFPQNARLGSHTAVWRASARCDNPVTAANDTKDATVPSSRSMETRKMRVAVAPLALVVAMGSTPTKPIHCRA